MNPSLVSYKQIQVFLSWPYLDISDAELRPVHTRELAPETRSRNTLQGKYPNQYTRLLLKHAPAKQISEHTRELASETESCNRFAPGACSLISNQFDMREQNSGAKLKFVAQHIFWLEIVGADEGALLRERVARACSGSKLPRVYRPLLWLRSGLCRWISKEFSIFNQPGNYSLWATITYHQGFSLCIT